MRGQGVGGRARHLLRPFRGCSHFRQREQAVTRVAPGTRLAPAGLQHSPSLPLLPSQPQLCGHTRPGGPLPGPVGGPWPPGSESRLVLSRPAVSSLLLPGENCVLLQGSGQCLLPAGSLPAGQAAGLGSHFARDSGSMGGPCVQAPREEGPCGQPSHREVWLMLLLGLTPGWPAAGSERGSMGLWATP